MVGSGFASFAGGRVRARLAGRVSFIASGAQPRHPMAATTMDLDADGLATRRAVLGDAYVDNALANATPFSAPLQELVTRHAWGNTWQRQGIDLRTRSIVTVSMLVALGRMHELEVHVRGALNNGVTPAELQEIFLHASVYCGFPAAVDAFRAAANVVADAA